MPSHVTAPAALLAVKFTVVVPPAATVAVVLAALIVKSPVIAVESVTLTLSELP